MLTCNIFYLIRRYVKQLDLLVIVIHHPYFLYFWISNRCIKCIILICIIPSSFIAIFHNIAFYKFNKIMYRFPITFLFFILITCFAGRFVWYICIGMLVHAYIAQRITTPSPNLLDQRQIVDRAHNAAQIFGKRRSAWTAAGWPNLRSLGCRRCCSCTAHVRPPRGRLGTSLSTKHSCTSNGTMQGSTGSDADRHY